MKEIEIFWNDLTEEAKEKLKKAGLKDENIEENLYPIATIVIEEEEK